MLLPNAQFVEQFSRGCGRISCDEVLDALCGGHDERLGAFVRPQNTENDFDLHAFHVLTEAPAVNCGGDNWLRLPSATKGTRVACTMESFDETCFATLTRGTCQIKLHSDVRRRAQVA